MINIVYFQLLWFNTSIASFSGELDLTRKGDDNMPEFEFVADITRFDAGTTRYCGENALVLFDCARLAYETADVVESKLTSEWNFNHVRFFNGPSTQAFVAAKDDCIVVSFRGSEEIADWFRNLDINLVSGPVGRVHNGFQTALNEIWGGNEGMETTVRDLRNNGQTVWLTGHSLGAALAVLAAVKLNLQSAIPANGLYTLGQPRVGNAEFITAFNDSFGGRAFRFVNNNDIITRVPPWIRGYRHGESMLYFDSREQLLDSISPWRQLIDGIRGVIGSIGELGPDALNDHSREQYTRLMKKNRDVQTRWS